MEMNLLYLLVDYVESESFLQLADEPKKVTKIDLSHKVWQLAVELVSFFVTKLIVSLSSFNPFDFVHLVFVFCFLFLFFLLNQSILSDLKSPISSRRQTKSFPAENTMTIC